MTLEPNEEIQWNKSNIVWYKSKYQAFPGQLIVTNKRFMYERAQIRAGGGLLGALISTKSKKTRRAVLFSAPINSLTFEKGDAVRKKNYKLKIGSTATSETIELLFDDSLFAELQAVLPST